MFSLFTINYSLFTAFSWWDVVWNAGWRSLLNQMTEKEQKEFEEAHLKEIEQVLGANGAWFNTEVLIAVGEKQ